MEVFEASQTFLAIRGPLDSFVILPQDTSPCYITFVPTYSSSQRPCINISYIFNWQQDFKFHFWKLTVPVFCMTICYFTYYLTGFFFLLLFIVSLINLRWVTPIWDTRKKKKKNCRASRRCDIVLRLTLRLSSGPRPAERQSSGQPQAPILYPPVNFYFWLQNIPVLLG